MSFIFDFSLDHHPLSSDTPQVEAAIQKLNLRNTWILYSHFSLVFFYFVISKLFRRLYLQNRHMRRDLRLLARCHRVFRRWSIRKAFWPFATWGHMIIIINYLIPNILFCVMSSGPDLLLLQLARRTGWLAIINFSILLLLSMKNTPLSKLTGYSYERLNVFHRWVGAVAWIQGCVHTIAIGIASSRLVPDQSYILLEMENVMGIIGLAAWTITIFAFPLLKKVAYELFYYAHIVLLPVIAVALYLHHPYCHIPVLVGVGLVILDRLIRTDRYIWHNRYSRALKATLKATTDGATLVTVPRGNLSWAPGSHAFLNIPRIRFFESHPFTIASITNSDDIGGRNNVQFLIRPKKGFTRALYQEALKSEEQMPRRRSKEVTAYVDGPYGAVPDFNMYDRIVLIAAGSGVTFTLPIALSLVRSRRVKSLHFIWSIRDRKSLEPVKDQLIELCSVQEFDKEMPLVQLSLNITGETKQPRMGTIKRVKSMLVPETNPSFQYDLYGSSSNSIVPSASIGPNAVSQISHSNHQSMEIDGSTLQGQPSPSGWMGVGHYRNVSAESQASVGSDAGLLSPPAPPRRIHSRSNGRDPMWLQPVSTPVKSPALDLPMEFNQQQQPRPTSFEHRPQVEALDMTNYEQTRWQQEGHRAPSPAEGSRRSSMSAISGHKDFRAFPYEAFDNFDAQGYISSASSTMEKSESQQGEGDRPKRDLLQKYYVYGRPDIPKLIADTVDIAEDFDTVAVTACGVTKMVEEVRKVTADLISGRGPSISLFCEEFGW